MRSLFLALLPVATAFAPSTPSRWARSVRSPPVALRAAPLELGSAESGNDALLAELIFTESDPRDLIVKEYEAYDDDFCDFVSERIAGSDDLDERAALKSLIDMIKATRQQMEISQATLEASQQAESQMAEELATKAAAARGPAPTTAAEMLKAADRIDKGSAIAGAIDIVSEAEDASDDRDASAKGLGLSASQTATYNNLLTKVLERKAGLSLEDAVEAVYTQCDYQFMQLLEERIKNAESAEGGEARAAAMTEVLATVNKLGADRIGAASETLRSIVSAGDPQKMLAKVAELAQQGAIDEPLVQLIQANMEQAEQAGDAGRGPAQVMRKLLERVQAEADRKVEPPIRLLRQLLRTESREARCELLTQAFRVKEQIYLGGEGENEKSEAAPEVPPPDFIKEAKALIYNFGNIEDDGSGKNFAAQLQMLVDEAEEVAVELYGEAKTPQEQQDAMWNEATTSVFDLENMELQADVQGEQMPWHNDAYDGMTPEMVTQQKDAKKQSGFDEDGVFRVGGS